MAILSRDEFASVAQAKAGSKGVRGIVNETKLFSRSSQTTSIFLSHAHGDKNVVEQAVAFFRGFGISVYVDWMDETMPEKTNAVTAQNIRGKIISNDKFIFLATNAGVLSKWCNWEVGYADTYKFDKKKLAILPLSDNNQTWNGNEYLQLYPRIEKGTTFTNDYYVHFPDKSLMTLEEWLKRQ